MEFKSNELDNHSDKEEFYNNLISKFNFEYGVGSIVFIEDIDEFFPYLADKEKVFEIIDYGRYGVHIVEVERKKGYSMSLQAFDNLTINKIN